MNSLSRRVVRALESKTRKFAEGDPAARNVYLDDAHARFNFVKSVLGHEIVEAFSLLSVAREVGIQLDYFQIDRSIGRFFEILRLRPKKGEEQPVISGLASELVTDFSHIQDGLESQFLFGETRLLSLPLRMRESLVMPYRRILEIHVSLLEEPTVLTYLDAARSLPRESWHMLIRQRPDAHEVARAADSEEMTAAAICFGFLYMASAIANLNSVIGRSASSEEAADSALLLEFVRASVDWRLDFKTTESLKRFDEIREMIADCTARELPYREATLFRDEFERLLNNAFQLETA